MIVRSIVFDLDGTLVDSSPDIAAALNKAFVLSRLTIEMCIRDMQLSAVGFGQQIGVAEVSSWNNPEPEVVLVIDSKGAILGATLGNDVNLRDVEGRSALLLPKAKDNNASAALGPFIRIFDEHYSLDDLRQAEVNLKVLGDDGFELNEISLSLIHI